MKFLIIPLLILAINGGVKFFVLLAKRRKIHGGRLLWTFFWVGQFPSAHGALLGSSLTLVWIQSGLSPVFAFCFFTSVLFLYGFLEDKKRQSLYEGYFSKSSDPSLAQIVKDKIIMDFSGHTLLDLAAGILEGIVLTFLILKLWQ